MISNITLFAENVDIVSKKMRDRRISEADFIAISYNVQNLFDGKKNGNEYSEYLPPKWKEQDYQRRLVSISNALDGLAINPSIIALEEVENEEVVMDMQKYYLNEFPYIAVTKNPRSATQNALLSVYKIIDVNYHSLQVPYNYGNRYILDVRLELPANYDWGIIQIIVVHLKSKRTSQSGISSDEIRKMQYLLIENIIEDDIPSIILGDFNDTNPQNHLSSVSRFNLYTLHSDVSGTYFYKGWEQIDHILLDTRADDMFEEEYLYVLDQEPFVYVRKKDSKMLPYRFIYHLKNFKATSDHLPLLFIANLK